jgi:hypothetical protein
MRKETTFLRVEREFRTRSRFAPDQRKMSALAQAVIASRRRSSRALHCSTGGFWRDMFQPVYGLAFERLLGRTWGHRLDLPTPP